MIVETNQRGDVGVGQTGCKSLVKILSLLATHRDRRPADPLHRHAPFEIGSTKDDGVAGDEFVVPWIIFGATVSNIAEGIFSIGRWNLERAVPRIESPRLDDFNRARDGKVVKITCLLVLGICFELVGCDMRYAAISSERC